MAVFETKNGDKHACGTWADVLGVVECASLRVINAGLSHGHEENSGVEDDRSSSSMEQRWIAAVSELAMALTVLPSPANPEVWSLSSDDVASFTGLDEFQLLKCLAKDLVTAENSASCFCAEA